jgi:tryptophan-rich sensory protein
MVRLIMFACFAISACRVWQDGHTVIITAIAFLYTMAMNQLVHFRQWEDERKQAELEACKRISASGTGL